MKRSISLLALVFMCFLTVNTVTANQISQYKGQHSNKSVQNLVTLHFFWSQDCPHCVAAHPFIDKLKAEYPWLRVREYEVSGNPQNGRLFEKMARDHGRETSFVPTFFVGKNMIVGYTSAETTGSEIRNAVLSNHK